MGIPKRGDPYGLGRWEVGHPDHTARAEMESNWPKPTASIHPPSPTVVNYGSPTARSSGGGGGFIVGLAKLVVGGFILLAVIGYFGSKPDSGGRHVPAGEDPTARDSYPATPAESAPMTTAPVTAAPVEASSDATIAVQPVPANEALPVEATVPVPSDAGSAASTPRLVGNDERVLAAINDVQAVSRQVFFLGKDGDVLVFQGHLNTPENDIYQTSFDVANLDLYHTTYSTTRSNLNIPCKASIKCASYAVFDSSAEDTGGTPKYRTPYESINIWSGSPEDAHRILQDLLQLQGLER